MSLTAQSPTLGYKRFLSDSDSPDTSSHLPKRSRHICKRRSPKCAKRKAPVDSYDLHLATLKSLFPHMDETVVVSVLKSTESDFDEAIRLLGQLQVSRREEAGRNPEVQERATQHQANNPEADRAGGEAAQAEQGGNKGEGREKGAGEWVQGLVQQMAPAKDLSEARVIAAHVLRAFEQAVMKSSAKAKQGELSGAHNRIAELSKENNVLKRAVNIQQTRLQEAVNTNKQQAQQAQAAVTELQEKVHMLEMTNYSLSMHLKQATDSQQYRPQHRDVF